MLTTKTHSSKPSIRFDTMPLEAYEQYAIGQEYRAVVDKELPVPFRGISTYIKGNYSGVPISQLDRIEFFQRWIFSWSGFGNMREVSTPFSFFFSFECMNWLQSAENNLQMFLKENDVPISGDVKRILLFFAWIGQLKKDVAFIEAQRLRFQKP